MKDCPNRWAVCVQGPQSQSVLPLGREIFQRWTAVPRAGHIGSEITHSIYGSLRVLQLSDLAILQQTDRQLAVQSFSQGQPPFIPVLGLQDDLASRLLFCSTELYCSFLTYCAERRVMELKVSVTCSCSMSDYLFHIFACKTFTFKPICVAPFLFDIFPL